MGSCPQTFHQAARNGGKMSELLMTAAGHPENDFGAPRPLLTGMN